MSIPLIAVSQCLNNICINIQHFSCYSNNIQCLNNICNNKSSTKNFSDNSSNNSAEIYWFLLFWSSPPTLFSRHCNITIRIIPKQNCAQNSRILKVLYNIFIAKFISQHASIKVKWVLTPSCEIEKGPIASCLGRKSSKGRGQEKKKKGKRKRKRWCKESIDVQRMEIIGHPVTVLVSASHA